MNDTYCFWSALYLWLMVFNWSPTTTSFLAKYLKHLQLMGSLVWFGKSFSYKAVGMFVSLRSILKWESPTTRTCYFETLAVILNQFLGHERPLTCCYFDINLVVSPLPHDDYLLLKTPLRQIWDSCWLYKNDSQKSYYKLVDNNFIVLICVSSSIDGHVLIDLFWLTIVSLWGLFRN